MAANQEERITALEVDTKWIREKLLHLEENHLAHLAAKVDRILFGVFGILCTLVAGFILRIVK